jgi:uncharacterized protein (DUF58 family)
MNLPVPHEALRRLELTVTRKLDGILHGDHLGLVPGHGTEMGEARPYVPGDDVRRIDWNVTARTAEPHVRDTIADRELETWLVIDVSPSLAFGTARCEKRDLVEAGAAAIAFLTARLGNRLGAILLEPGGTVRVLPARSGRAHALGLLHRTMNVPRVDGGGATDLAAGLQAARHAARRRGLVVVISDFLVPGGWERQLTTLGLRHEVLAIEVLDPRELELPAVGLLTLVDPETGRRVEVQTSRRRVRDRYATAAAEQRAAIAKALRRSGVEHVQLRTDRDWVLDLVRFVATRRHRARYSTAARPPVGTGGGR